MDTSDPYFGCLCRTCMNKLIEASSIDGDSEPQQQCQSIFDMIEEEYGRLRIAELLSQAVPKLELQLSDELPKKICCKCLQQLLSVYRFQQMCLQSEQQMRPQVFKNKTVLSITAATAAGDIVLHSFPLDNSSVQEPLLETTALIVNTEAAETSDVNHLLNIDQLLEDCKDSQGNFSEFIKDAPVRDDSALSYSLDSSQTDSTHQNLDHSSIQEPFLETTDKIVTQVEAETSATDHLLSNDQLQEVSQGNFGEVVKNESIEDDEPEMEYSDGDTIQSIISVKDEILAIETEGKIKETKATNCHKSYECPQCRKTFKASSNLYHHKKIHEEAKREDCDICGKRIAKKYLEKHKLIHSHVKPHKCEFCGKRFARNTSLRTHIRTHTDEKPYKCKYCESAFSRLDYHKEHMILHHGLNIYRCEFCPSAFSVAKELRAHLSTHKNEDSKTREQNMKALHEAEVKLKLKFSKKEQFETEAKSEDKPYKCSYCPRRFNMKANLRTHKTIHEGARREDCDICGKSIIKRDFKKHKLYHSNEKAHKCGFCEKRFTRPSDLRTHMRHHTGEKPYKCNYCESAFARPQNRTRHMRSVHLGVNVYRCELCPLAFPTAKELRMHFTSHENEDSETRERNMKAIQEAETKLSKTKANIYSEDKPYKCSYCPRSFNMKANLRTHKTIHEGARREDCDICGKSIIKRDLKIYKLCHSNEKAHKCGFCEKRFTRPSDLRTHLRHHTGEKPFKCNYCESAFARPQNRTRHMRSLHLGANVYRCELCPLAFPTAKELRMHFTSHENDDSETRERNMKALQEAEAKLQLKLSKKETQQPSKEESQQQFKKKS